MASNKFQKGGRPRKIKNKKYGQQHSSGNSEKPKNSIEAVSDHKVKNNINEKEPIKVENAEEKAKAVQNTIKPDEVQKNEQKFEKSAELIEKISQELDRINKEHEEAKKAEAEQANTGELKPAQTTEPNAAVNSEKSHVQQESSEQYDFEKNKELIEKINEELQNLNIKDNKKTKEAQSIIKRIDLEAKKAEIEKRKQEEEAHSEDIIKRNKKIIERVKRKTYILTTKKMIIIISIILLLAMGGIYYLAITVKIPIKIITPIIKPVTIPPSLFAINSCRTLDRAGYYIISNSINANTVSTCISINASNVYISCNGRNITGAGPFVNSPPFTYGISADNKTNITLSKCNVKDFSYGVYMDNVSNASILSSNLSINFVSELALINSHNINATNNHFSKSETYKGAVYISNNSSQITFKNNSVLYNAFYGINVSSQGNRFINNYINGTPVSFYCSLNSSFTKSSYAKSNICYNNTQCSFVACTGFNKPADLSYINLSNSRNTQKEINECGSINNPGTYSLSSNINMGNFVNISNPIVNALRMPCVTINADNVKINCNGHTISNAPIGILAQNRTEVSISNCDIINSHAGIRFENIVSGNLTNINVSGGNVSVLLKNTSGIDGSNIKIKNSSIGLYLLNSGENKFNLFNISNNELGIYANRSIGNIFTNGTAKNNSIVDVFANNNANKTDANLMSQVTCGVTDANWAACKLHLSVSLAYFPVNSCQVISHSGNYTLVSNLVSGLQTCISINASNVKFNCAGHSITGTDEITGISAYNKTNITISSCKLYGFDNGVVINNSSIVKLLNNSIQSNKLGISFNKISEALVHNNDIKYPANASIFLNNVSKSVISGNNASFGLSQSTGIAVVNSDDNLINNNTGVNNYFGMRIENTSGNNTVMNNTMLSTKTDYYCSPADSNMSSENGGINYGNTKIGCHWMASVSKLSPDLSCNLVPSGSLYSLGRDFIYPYNSTCYQILKSNDSTLNCNGHTLIATKGGVLIDAENATGITLENCYLKGFSSPVIAKNASINILNNTFYSTQQEGTAISSLYSQRAHIEHNYISGYAIGINILNDLSSLILSNNVHAINAYTIRNSTNIQLSNDTSSNNSRVGLAIVNSYLIQLYNNAFFGRVGLSCILGSGNSTTNLDLGNNTCSSNIGCSWIVRSSPTCH